MKAIARVVRNVEVSSDAHPEASVEDKKELARRLAIMASTTSIDTDHGSATVLGEDTAAAEVVYFEE